MKTAKSPEPPRVSKDLKLVLGLAVFLFVGAVLLLITSQPVIAFHQSYKYAPSGADAAPPGLLHFYGFAGLVASLFLFRLYFKIRKQRRPLPSSQYRRRHES